MAGIDEAKLVCTDKEIDAPDKLIFDGTDKIFILHELYAADEAMKVKDKVKELIQSRRNV